MPKTSFPRVIDEVILVTDDLTMTLDFFRNRLHYDHWEEFETTSAGVSVTKEAIHLMKGGKALHVVFPLRAGTVYDELVQIGGNGIFGVRERIPDEEFDSFLAHLASKGIDLTEENGVVWADFAKTLGCCWGFVKASSPAHPEVDGINLRQFCLATKNIYETAEFLSDVLLLGPTEIGHGNNMTVQNAHCSNYPEGMPDFEFLAGMIFYSNMEFEVVQSVRGPLAYNLFLNRRGPGLHHIKVEVPEGQWESTLEYFKSIGIREGLRGRLGTCEFSNQLTEEYLGFVYELSDGAPMLALPEGYDPIFYP